MATRHEFLSPEWIEAARTLRAAAVDAGGAIEVSLRMNLLVLEVPGHPDGLAAHVDTTAGFLDVELGHLEESEVRVSLDYPTAYAILVEGDPEAAMGAFLSGRILVEGDLTKLLEFQASPIDAFGEVAVAIRAMTAVLGERAD